MKAGREERVGWGVGVGAGEFGRWREEGRGRFFSPLQKLSGGTISMENGVCPGRH